MPLYEYCCDFHGVFETYNPMSKSDKPAKCPICKKLSGRILSFSNISGTRDSFGIGNQFVDERTGKTIDNWKSWERAGYRPALDGIKNHRVKESVKEKMKSLKGVKQRQPTPAEMPL